MIALSLAGIALISLLAQWLAWSLRVPAILFLLLSGLLLGPITGALDPDRGPAGRHHAPVDLALHGGRHPGEEVGIHAAQDHDLDVDALVVAEASVGKSITMKRFATRGRGKSTRILKPFSRLRIVVREQEEA